MARARNSWVCRTLYSKNRMEAGEESQLAAQSPQVKRLGRGIPGLAIAPALLAGLALRLWMLRNVFEVNGDSLIYGGLAKNILLHGIYGLTTGSGILYPTLIRLPGYPIFLAACFRLFGMENYFSAACVQVGVDLLTCLLVADFARRIAPEGMGRGAALATLWLAALCPFTASYTAEPLTETLTIFVLALAMWAMARFRDEPSWVNALWFTFAVSYAALLRPDGALAGIAFAPALLIGSEDGTVTTQGASSGVGVSLRDGWSPTGRLARIEIVCIFATLVPIVAWRALPKLRKMAVVCVLLALSPFAIWTARNWSVFHVFEPLAPRLATDPDESSNPGWERWVKSWCLDYISTYEIYWNVPGDTLDVAELPSRAFDSPAQRAETATLAANYNDHGMELTPEIDARFERLADERIAANPLRSYVWLPLGRLADMWLRPRVEDLDIDLDWWVYSHHHSETEFSWAYAGLNAVYLCLGLIGILLRPRCWGALLAYMVLRSLLLLTIEAPETRYTLECFPMLFAGGGVAIAWMMGRRRNGSASAGSLVEG